MTVSSAPSTTAGSSRRRRLLIAAVAGLVVAALVAVGGALFWQARPAESRAVSTLVVLPASESVEVASYYDTLSSGQITTTFAEILALRGTEGSTLDADLQVDVVPDTSLIQITATASDGDTAESAADAALASSRPYFDQLSSPYDVFEVRSAAGTAEAAGLAPGLLAGVVAAVAVIAGLATFLGVQALQGAGLAPQHQAAHRPSPTPRPANAANGHEPRTAPQVAVPSASTNGAPTTSAPRKDLPGAGGPSAQPAR